jgi:hypothetical protein
VSLTFFITVEKMKKSSEERDELGNLLTDMDFAGEYNLFHAFSLFNFPNTFLSRLKCRELGI